MEKRKNDTNDQVRIVMNTNVKNEKKTNDFYKDLNVMSFKLSLKRLNSFYTSQSGKTK